MAHIYTVEITKSIANQEIFRVYSLYQEKVHNEDEKSIKGFARFLCNCPLFDPEDKVEATRDPTAKGDIDDKRVSKNEGIWP